MKISRDQKRLKTEIDIMKRETDNLQAQLNHAQEQLPANGEQCYFCSCSIKSLNRAAIGETIKQQSDGEIL